MKKIPPPPICGIYTNAILCIVLSLFAHRQKKTKHLFTQVQLYGALCFFSILLGNPFFAAPLYADSFPTQHYISSSLTDTPPAFWDGTKTYDWTGNGTETDPIIISNPQQLAGFADSVNAGRTFLGRYIRLSQDIYLTDTTLSKEQRPEWEPIGHHVMHGIGQAMDSASFAGHFDGAGYTIHFLYTGNIDGWSGWNDPDDPTFEGTIDGSTWYKALFGFVDSTATITNLKLKDIAIMGSADVAMLALYNRGTITDITASGVGFGDGSVGSGGGGLVFSNYGTIERCHVYGKVQAGRNVGMIAGNNSEGAVIRDCYVSGHLLATQYYAGGLVGTNSGLIENCGADVDVRHGSYNYNATDVGGFVGQNNGIIRNCYSNGDIYTVAYHGGGGFCANNLGRIESCLATGDVYGQNYGLGGAFVNTNGYYSFYNGWSTFTPGTIINCFATGRNILTDNNMKVAALGFCASQSDNSNSLMINCYYIGNHGIDTSESNATNAYMGNTFIVDSASLQTKAFVDTLNMIAAVLGTSTWQYNAGSYPTPTGVIANNIHDVFAGGNGTETTPYLIGNKQQLRNLAILVNKGYDFRDKYILQTADIQLNRPMAEWGEEMPTEWRPIGDYDYTYSSPRYFRGIYDGGFHEVQNLYINTFKESQGFFGTLHHNAVVKNLAVTDAYVKGNGCAGILAGSSSRYSRNVLIAQCHTSGQVYGSWAAGGILGEIALDGNTNILNCSSAAKPLQKNKKISAVVGNQNYIGGEAYSNDTIANFLYTGTGCSVVPMSGNERHFNGFYDNDTLRYATDDYTIKTTSGKTTAYLRGKEIVNIYNNWVDAWNAAHPFQLNYWQQNQGAYPSVSPIFIPPHTISFVSNGGTDIIDMHALDSSYIPSPAPPIQENKQFLGWYSDPALTHLFVFDTALIVSDTTLYAKWADPTTYDISKFKNPFATSYTINTKEELLGFAMAVKGIENVIDAMTFEGKTVKLGTDILLNDTTYWQEWATGNASAVPWTPIGNSSAKFRGTFDGQGHTIAGMYISLTSSADNQGLFGYIGVNAMIKNLNISCAVIKSSGSGDNYGLLAGNCRGSIENCHTQGKVIGSLYEGVGCRYIGGLIGNFGGNDARNIKILYSSANVEITGNETVGGLVGDYCSYDTIQYCYTKGHASGRTVAGIAGSGARIKNCYSLMNVNCYPVYYTAVGGLETSGDYVYLENCYYAGTASNAGKVTDGVTSTSVSSNKMKSVYYLSHNAPRSNASASYTYGEARSDLQLRAKTTFTGWDFQHIWGRKDSINSGYPYLRCQYNEFIEDDADVEYIPLTDFSIDPIPTLTEGETYQLAIRPTPGNATITKVTYQTDNPDICSVTKTGLLTATAEGQTTISVQVESEKITLNKTVQVVIRSIGTGIVSTGSAKDSLAPRKIIYQGQVYILRANTLYTPLGDRVSVIK